MATIHVAGHLCIDLTPELGFSPQFVPGQLLETGPLSVRLGGCVANTGRALRALGEDVALQACIGDDALGALIRDLLEPQDQLLVVPGATTSYSIVVEPPGQDRTFWHHTGVNAHFDVGGLEAAGDALHVGYPALLPATVADDGAPLVGALTRARNAGVTTSVDHVVVDPDSEVGRLDWPRILREVTAVSDVVSPSADDLASMLDPGREASLEAADDWCDHLLDLGAAIAVVTAGRAGMVLKSAELGRVRSGGRLLAGLGREWDEATVRLEGRPVSGIVTATGAGDASTAGLLAALRRGLPPGQAASLARATAEAVMTGAIE